MKIDLTYKEANLIMAIIWELGEEECSVLGTWEPMWRLTETGREICSRVAGKLEDANAKTDKKGRDLSGAPKGSIQEAKWK